MYILCNIITTSHTLSVSLLTHYLRYVLCVHKCTMYNVRTYTEALNNTQFYLIYTQLLFVKAYFYRYYKDYIILYIYTYHSTTKNKWDF